MSVKYRRVKDKETGHQYDVLVEQFDENAHESLEDRYPDSSYPRTPKPSVNGGGSKTAGDSDADTKAPRARRSRASKATDDTAAAADPAGDDTE